MDENPNENLEEEYRKIADIISKNLEANVDQLVLLTEDLFKFQEKLQEKKLLDGKTISSIFRENSNNSEKKRKIYLSLKNLNLDEFDELHRIFLDLGYYQIPHLLKPWNPLKQEIKVMGNIRSRSKYNQAEEYHMLNENKGRALIINMNYNSERSGSERDVVNLKELWEQLGYKVKAVTFPDQQQGKAGLETTIEKFWVEANEEKASSTAMFVMSHGGETEVYETSFIEIGSEKVTSEWVISQFSPTKYPNLRDKPKLIFFQMCRGQTRERGRESISSEDGCVPCNESLDTSNITDLLVVFASAPGHVAIRDPVGGTLFVQQMCQTFMHEACENCLQQMLINMDEAIKNLQLPGFGTQTIVQDNRMFCKKFYFYKFK